MLPQKPIWKIIKGERRCPPMNSGVGACLLVRGIGVPFAVGWRVTNFASGIWSPRIIVVDPENETVG